VPLGVVVVVSGAGVLAAGAGVLAAGLGELAAPGWLAGVVPQAARLVRPTSAAARPQRLKAGMTFTSVPGYWT
jgi:X-X-X-Leu-X-X-Gly heptad repeat protein